METMANNFPELMQNNKTTIFTNKNNFHRPIVSKLQCTNKEKGIKHRKQRSNAYKKGQLG